MLGAFVADSVSQKHSFIMWQGDWEIERLTVNVLFTGGQFG